MNKLILQLGITLILSTLLLCSGCATLYLNARYPVTNLEKNYQTIDSDELIAVAHPVQLNQLVTAIFIGKKYHYQSIQGHHQLNNIIQTLTDEERLISADPLNFILYPDHQSFKTRINFIHPIPISQLTTDKKKQLLTLGFNTTSNHDAGQSDEQYMTAQIDIMGYIHSAELTQPIQHYLEQSIPIKIQYETEKRTFKNQNLLKQIVLTPLAIGYDVITFPITLGTLYEISRQKNTTSQ
ncbi:hypothetical protein [Acinetobacter populi]|uniref:Uncharacterized protein n=1 Tax=Acinetobacter populi TaxID=1582270 RepID=A0A1Z9Z327_9GAMM|nr:hypothetical protein [Acinetobacter populi]OUY08860.1 hypothetical protein CAP51_04395 [Acinetobacter populi]